MAALLGTVSGSVFAADRPVEACDALYRQGIRAFYFARFEEAVLALESVIEGPVCPSLKLDQRQQAATILQWARERAAALRPTTEVEQGKPQAGH